MGPGAGGEYDVQDGFGWTNGVYLDLISKYGDQVSTSDFPSGSSRAKPIYAIVLGTVAARMMAGIFIGSEIKC